MGAKTSLVKKIEASLVSLCVLAGFVFVASPVAKASVAEVPLYGDVKIYRGGAPEGMFTVAYNNGTEAVEEFFLYSEPVNFSGSATEVSIVVDGVAMEGPVTISMNSVSIKNLSAVAAPMQIESGTVNLVLSGSNELEGNGAVPAIMVLPDAVLNITGGYLCAKSTEMPAIGNRPMGTVNILGGEVYTYSETGSSIGEGGYLTLDNNATLTLANKSTSASISFLNGTVYDISGPYSGTYINGERDGSGTGEEDGGDEDSGGTSIDVGTVQNGDAGTGWDVQGNVIRIAQSGSYTITGATSVNRIVQLPTAAEANYTVTDVSIDATSGNFCAFELQGTAAANLTLVGDNELLSGVDYAGLQVPQATSLTIMAASTGSLTAKSGTRNETSFGAGIGGGGLAGCQDAGTIQIYGGTVTALAHNGAGIGGGSPYATSGGAGGTINIQGGVVVAESAIGAGIGGGGQGAGSSNSAGGDSGFITIGGAAIVSAFSGAGAGIGSASPQVPHYMSGGAVDSIHITGGFVTACSFEGAADIGMGSYGTAGSEAVKITGGSVLALNNYIDPQPVNSAGAAVYPVTVPAVHNVTGAELYGAAVSVAGQQIALTRSKAENQHMMGPMSFYGFTFPANTGAILYLPAGSVDDVSVGAATGGRATVTAAGPNVISWAPALDLSSLDIVNGDIQVLDDENNAGKVKVVQGGVVVDNLSAAGGITITQSTAASVANTILVDVNTARGVVALTLDRVNISVASVDKCAMELRGTSRVSLTLQRNSSLSSGGSHAGLQVPKNTSLTITAASTGNLTAFGATTADSGGAGIGGAGVTDETLRDAGTIIIHGGTILAVGDGGAGVGGGAAPSGNAGRAGNITINGGTVTAFATSGAGIGGGASISPQQSVPGANGTVTINGGIVTATSSIGAGIGSGANGARYGLAVNAIDTVTIAGGFVTASHTAGQYDIGIAEGPSTAVVITGGSLWAPHGAISPEPQNAAGQAVIPVTVPAARNDTGASLYNAAVSIPAPGAYTAQTQDSGVQQHLANYLGDMPFPANTAAILYLPAGTRGDITVGSHTGGAAKVSAAPTTSLHNTVVWNALFGVTYTATGATGVPADNTLYLAGEQVPVSPARPARSQWDFAGWSASSGGNGLFYQPGARVPMPSGGLQLYAQWSRQAPSSSSSGASSTTSTGGGLPPPVSSSSSFSSSAASGGTSAASSTTSAASAASGTGGASSSGGAVLPAGAGGVSAPPVEVAPGDSFVITGLAPGSLQWDPEYFQVSLSEDGTSATITPLKPGESVLRWKDISGQSIEHPVTISEASIPLDSGEKQFPWMPVILVGVSLMAVVLILILRRKNEDEEEMEDRPLRKDRRQQE